MSALLLAHPQGQHASCTALAVPTLVRCHWRTTNRWLCIMDALCFQSWPRSFPKARSGIRTLTVMEERPYTTSHRELMSHGPGSVLCKKAAQSTWPNAEYSLRTLSSMYVQKMSALFVPVEVNIGDPKFQGPTWLQVQAQLCMQCAVSPVRFLPH